MIAHFRPICWPLGLGIPLFARLWSGRALFDGISGDFVLCPCFAGGSRSPPSPASIFLAGDFLYTKFCVQTRVKPPPLGFSARFGLNRRQRRRSERRKARARPPCADAGGRNIPHRRTRPTRRRGRRAPKGAEGAHGAASGARTPTAGGRPPTHGGRERSQGAGHARN